MTSEHTLLFAVANYVYPHYWSYWEQHLEGSSNIFTTFGIHPHMLVNGVSNRMWRELNKLITTPKSVALGETGIDMTSKCQGFSSWSKFDTQEAGREHVRANQEEAFVIHMQIAAQYGKPIIIHCRDQEMDLLLLEHYNWFTNLSIHIHNFSWSFKEYEEGNKASRNIIVCFRAAAIQNPNRNDLQQIIAKIPDNRNWCSISSNPQRI